MSVINKMLRDLDQRQAGQVAAQPAPGKQTLRGTASLAVAATPASPGFASRKAYGLGVAALLLALLAGGAWWWWQAHPTGTAPAAETPVAKPAPESPTPKQTTTATAPASAPTPTPTQSGSASMVSALVSKPAVPAHASVLPASAALVPASPRAAATAATIVKVPAPAAPLPATAASTATAMPTHAAATPAAAVNPPASAEPLSNGARQLQAGREALAQAQSLWAAGSHDAATELLQQALSLAERTGGAASPASVQLLSSLVRELGRMQLAEGRAAATLDLLTRLEPVLGRDADVWALRGNAAQRLGRHQDSVRAYGAALQLRANEQRWVLGSAVSLAALGQTAQATEMAERARALGPISKEVQAYLRQAGVQINEP